MESSAGSKLSGLRLAQKVLLAAIAVLAANAAALEIAPDSTKNEGCSLLHSSASTDRCEDVTPSSSAASDRKVSSSLTFDGGNALAETGVNLTKISNAGNVLPAHIEPGTAPGAWGCTRDEVSGLVWRLPTTPSLSWHGARRSAFDARAAMSCGSADWRVPNSHELHGLVNYNTGAAASINTTYFPATRAVFHWTNDADPASPAQRARVVNFGGGFVHSASSTHAADVRLVSGGRWSGQRTEVGNGPIFDPATGLFWDHCSIAQIAATQCSGASEMLTWAVAAQRVQQRNAQNWNGHNDWRLPSAKELATLLKPTQRHPSIDVALFPNTLGAAYWSSTPFAANGLNAWAVFFGDGNIFAKEKVTLGRVRIVRSAAPSTQFTAADALYADSFDSFAQVPQSPTSNLPVITLTTASSAPIQREVYINGTMAIASANPIFTYSGAIEIRGRGNSTWSMPKKPYGIRATGSAELLGMPTSRHWALLANYADKSLLRNLLAFTLGERLQMAWTPCSRMVEVNLNGQYQGVYQLVEKIRVDEDRVDIIEMSNADQNVPEVTGGYLFEIDGRRDCATSVQFDTVRGTPYCIDTPADDEIRPAQHSYLYGYINSFETALYSSNFTDPTSGYAAFIHTSTFIDWYLVNELMANIDAQGFSSIWGYKDRNDKLSRGPLWDFDLAAGNANYASASEPQGFWIRQGLYYDRLFNDPKFSAATRARWDASKAAHLDSIPEFIDAIARDMPAATDRNFAKWPILQTRIWPNVVVTGSYEGEISFLRDWLHQRIAWLDENL